MTIVPREPGLTAAFVLPEGVMPSRSNLPGVVTRGRWRAAYIGVPAGRGHLARVVQVRPGVAAAGRTRRGLVSPRFPGGGGWQSLPAWLPQQNTCVGPRRRLDPAAPAALIAPVPPLR